MRLPLARYPDEEPPAFNDADPQTPLLRALVDELQLRDNVMTDFAPIRPRRPGEAGYFLAPGRGSRPGPLPRIVVHREHQARPGCGMCELVTLAHEAGHFESFRRGEQTDGYVAALDLFDAHVAAAPRRRRPSPQRLRGFVQTVGALRNDVAQEVFAEERRAWDYGRQRLSRVGFSQWGEYERACAAGLRQYVLRFR